MQINKLTPADITGNIESVLGKVREIEKIFHEKEIKKFFENEMLSVSSRSADPENAEAKIIEFLVSSKRFGAVALCISGQAKDPVLISFPASIAPGNDEILSIDSHVRQTRAALRHPDSLKNKGAGFGSPHYTNFITLPIMVNGSCRATLTGFDFKEDSSASGTFLNWASLSLASSIIREKLLEKALQEDFSYIEARKKIYENIINDIDESIVIVDSDMKIFSVNEKFREIFNLSEPGSVGKKCAELFKCSFCDSYCPFRFESLYGERFMNGNIEFFLDDHTGRERFFSINFIEFELDGKKLLIEIWKDMSEIYFSERMASLGELSATVAHEVNNHLTGILGYTEILQKSLNLTDKEKEDMKVIKDATLRISSLVKELLGYSRQAGWKTVKCSVNNIISDVLILLKPKLKTNRVQVSTYYDDNLPAAELEPFRLQQVFLNMFINAVHAMPGGGALTVRTEQVKNETQGGGCEKFIKVTIEDTGHGVPEDLKKKIFEPFFTTKKDRNGMGLGLSICNGIINRHGGRIELESEIGKGTKFSIYLPA